MENLLSDFDKSFAIANENKAGCERKRLFKSNALGQAEDSKERRRAQLLDDYKRKRDTLVNAKRGLLNDDFDLNDEELLEWNESKKFNRRKRVNRNCKDQLMLSEWLLDRPHDLETSWTCVLCPEGRRTLVVAKKGCTRSYSKAGLLKAIFRSSLPNGAPSSENKKSDMVILDCVWMASTNKLFALDVLYWRNQKLLDCDAQFRLYWLKSKLDEIKKSQPASDEDLVDVLLPPHCLFSQLTTTLNEHDPSQVDGILFYHNGCPYVSGQTPLVGWLKPFMLKERFGLEVPEAYMSLQPDTYVNLEQWVESVSHSHTRQLKKNKKEVDMDCSSSRDSSDVSSETCTMEDA